jgi:hypothetical protein
VTADNPRREPTAKPADELFSTPYKTVTLTQPTSDRKFNRQIGYSAGGGVLLTAGYARWGRTDGRVAGTLVSCDRAASSAAHDADRAGDVLRCVERSGDDQRQALRSIFNAAQQLDLGADQTFANGVTFTEAGFVDQVVTDPKFQISDLLLTGSNEGFAAIGQEPTFMEIRKAETTLSSANKLLVDYAGALQQLASPGLVSEATFDQLAKDLIPTALR